MTVSSLVPVNNYTGNGSTCQFDFDFLIEDESELVVTLINKKENIEEKLIFGVDYSINEIGSKNGSFIIYPLEEISSHEVLSPDEVLSLSLNLSIKQESEFENSATLKLDVLEWTFDYIVRVLQILSRKIDRSIKIVEGENTKPEELVKNLFDAEFNSKAYSKAAYQNLEEIKEMNNKINSDMKKLDYELTEVLHKSGDEEVTGVKNFTNTILYKGENLLDVVSQDYESAIQGKQDILTAGENITIVDNVISAEDGINNKVTNCILAMPEITYSGNTFTVKAGTKALVSNGFINGAFNNIKWMAKTDVVQDVAFYGDSTHLIYVIEQDRLLHSHFLGSFSEAPEIGGANGTYYNTVENCFYLNGTTQWYKTPIVFLAEMIVTDGVITTFNAKEPIKLVNYSDIKNNVHIVETYSNGTSWYNIYSNGWCEQGGQASSTTQVVQIIFLIPYKDTNYTALAVSTVGGSTSNYNPNIGTLSQSGFYFNSMINKACGCHWRTCGYIR